MDINTKNNLISIYIDKSIIGKKVFIKQIAIIHTKDGKYKFSIRYIKNEYKQAVNSIEIEKALLSFYEIIKNKDIILFNDSNFDYLFLKRSYYKYFNCDFDNKIYDVSDMAKKLKIEKFNLANLARTFNCDFKNIKNLPKSVYKAQLLYLVGLKIFTL